MTWISAIFSLVTGMLGREIWEWLPALTRALLKGFTRILPAQRRDLRLLEWEAELWEFGQRRFAALLWVLSLFPICVWERMTEPQALHDLFEAIAIRLFCYLLIFHPIVIAFAVLSARWDVSDPVRWAIVACSPWIFSIACVLVGFPTIIMLFASLAGLVGLFRLSASALGRFVTWMSVQRR